MTYMYMFYLLPYKLQNLTGQITFYSGADAWDQAPKENRQAKRAESLPGAGMKTTAYRLRSRPRQRLSSLRSLIFFRSLISGYSRAGGSRAGEGAGLRGWRLEHMCLYLTITLRNRTEYHLILS